MAYKIDIKFLNKRKTLFRLDVFPFIIFYALTLFSGFILNFFNIIEGMYLVEEVIFSKIFFIGLFFVHALTYLIGHWSNRFKSIIQFYQLSSKERNLVENSSHVKVTICKKNMAPIIEICDIYEHQTYFYFIFQNTISKSNDNSSYYFFTMHNKKFIYDENKKIFIQLKPPIKNALQFYLSKEKIPNSEYFDENSLDIPIKAFSELLLDQIMEPFSFFQFVSISLWLMDENRLSSIFTLFMLFLTSCTVVIQRMRTMMTLKQMKLQPSIVSVQRGNIWIKISSEELHPGDIIKIQAGNQTKPYSETNLKSKNSHSVYTLPANQREEFQNQIPFSKFLPSKLFQTEKMNTDSYKNIPCDVLLLSGNCVVNESMLTGESIPQIKDALDTSKGQDLEQPLQWKSAHKNSILFCGTEILQTFPQKANNNQNKNCYGYVLRTGFNTSKGKLISSMLFNNENIHIKQTDGFLLIFILLIFSILSSGYVLHQGLADPTRDRNKLFLRCILIITTVVPPELPMILSIAVNTSLLFLQRKKIFCTEPFRIPMVGGVKVCAFDKTGTLTSDQLQFKGLVHSLENYQKMETKFSDFNDNSVSVLAGCHSLIHVDKKIEGDPIEVLFFNNSDFTYSSVDKTASNRKQEKVANIQLLFPFKSDLKRMSTVVKWTTQKTKHEYRVLCKGAPEVIQNLLAKVPDNYQKAYQYYSKQGYRVLALAYRVLDSEKEDLNFNHWEREQAEMQLTFAGFFITESPLKKETKDTIMRLQQGNFKIIMITGDNILTANSIGKQLELGSTNIYLTVYYNEELKQIQFFDDDDKRIEVPFSAFNTISDNYTLCICGDQLQLLSDNLERQRFLEIVRNITIFARTSPIQKEEIITCFKESKIQILMCGDGTNDVGGLKKADVGIALVTINNSEELHKKEKEKKKEAAAFQEKLKQLPAMQKLQAMKERQQEILKKHREQQQNQLSSLFSDTDYKFGDACIAAPFTSKHLLSIRCVEIIIRQGICTLTTAIQTYKILFLSSLVQAYSMTKLNLQALKFSEGQSLIIGITGAVNYYYFSNAKPVKKFPGIDVQTTVFEFYTILSVLLQVGLHLFAMHYAVQNIAIKYSSEKDLEVRNDDEFVPTFFNTVIFLFSLLSQNCTFLFNYSGQPFMQSISENGKYLKWLLIPIGVCFFLAANLSPGISEALSLKFEGVPDEAIREMVVLFVIVTVLNYTIDRITKYMKYKKFYGWV